MDWYVHWVMGNPLLSAAVQFAILGTAGEVIAHVVKTKRVELPFGFVTLLFKIIAWAILGVFVKYGFAGMKGGLDSLIKSGMLPELLRDPIPWAVTVSVSVNLFFGPQLMAFHRLEDNIIARKWNFNGIENAWKTLIWFWIPAHSITFALPVAYQIGLAAVWGFVLGLILGLAMPKK